MNLSQKQTKSTGCYAGNGSVYAQWNNAAVSNIFNNSIRGWDNTAGSTIDLYFSGNHWSTHSGNSGLFAIARRGGSYGNDAFYILSVQNGALRMPYRDFASNEAETFLAGSRLANNVVYRLTVRQKAPAMEVYTNGVFCGSVYCTNTFLFPATNVNYSSSTGRKMCIGDRGTPWYTGTLQTGEWVDEVAVYNGYYLPSDLPTPGGPLALTHPPPSTTVIEGASATFTNVFSGLGNMQWYSNDVAIAGATLPFYTIPAASAAMNGDRYKVVVSNINYTITSTNAILRVSSDVTKPTIVSVQALGTSNVVFVKFSKYLSSDTSQNPANYTITNSLGGVIAVYSATLASDQVTVTLYTDNLSEGQNYFLVVSNIQDLALIPNTIVPGTTVPFTFITLVGFWQFEEGSGTTTADSSPAGFTGSLVNGPTWTSSPFGRWCLGYANNQYVDVGNPTALQLTGPMTLTAWVWPTATALGGGRVVDKQGLSGSRGWSLSAETAQVFNFAVAVNSTTLVNVEVPCMTNVWTHVGCVYDPDNAAGPMLLLYTNGVLAGTNVSGVPGSQYNSGLHVAIGARPDGTTPWAGLIDEVRIYCRALTNAEIATLAAPVFLKPTLGNNQVILNWAGAGQLLAAPAVTGTYTNVMPTPAPPYTNTIGPGGSLFYRLELPPTP